MTANGWFQIWLFLGVVFLLTKPIGIFMTRVFNREQLLWTRCCARLNASYIA